MKTFLFFRVFNLPLPLETYTAGETKDGLTGYAELKVRKTNEVKLTLIVDSPMSGGNAHSRFLVMRKCKN